MTTTPGRDRRGLRRAVPLALAGALLLAGCMDMSDYAAPSFPFAASYRGGAGTPVLLTHERWWTRMNDPQFTALVDAALTGNLSLAQAADRVDSARAQSQAARGSGFLTPSLSAGFEDDTTGRDDTRGSAQAQLGLDWVLDPYGARGARRRAVEEQAEATAAERDAAQLLVLSNLGNAYVELRYRQRLLALRQQELRNGRQTLNLTRNLADSQAATRLEVTRTEARVAEILSQIPGAEAAIAAQQNQIAVLTGRAPGQVRVGPGDQPRPAMSPQIGIPADLLRNRPDIRAAERRYYAALAQVDEARAALYPSLSLGGVISLNALTGGGSAAVDYFLGPKLALPQLPTESNKARVTAQEAAAREALNAWRERVLKAILDVENALVDYRAAAQAATSAARAVQLYSTALSDVRSVFQGGEATLSDLIDAEKSVAQAQNTLAETIYREGVAFMALNVGLGAGSAVQAE